MEGPSDLDNAGKARKGKRSNIAEADKARKGKRPAIAGVVSFASAPEMLRMGLPMDKTERGAEEGNFAAARKARAVVEIAPASPEPELSVGEVARQIEETKVLDVNSRFAKEIGIDTESVATVMDGAFLQTLNNSFEHECLEEAVVLLGATSRPDAPDDQIRGTKYVLKPIPAITLLAHQIWAIWFIIRRWVFDIDLPGVLLADEMGLGKTFTVLAASLYAKTVAHELMSEKGEEYAVPFLFGRTLPHWREEVARGFPGLSPMHREWYPCTHTQPIPRRLFQLLDKELPTVDVAPWHPVLCVVLPSVRETFVSVIKTITAGTRFSIRDLSAEGGADLCHTHINFSLDNLERMWDVHVITYNAFTERAQHNSSGTLRQLTKGTWSWGIFDESHRYKGAKSRGWKVAFRAAIGFKVQVTATPAYHSLQDWTNLARWLFTIPEQLENPAAVDLHGPEALAKAVADVLYAVRKELPAAEQQAAAQAMIAVARPWTIRRWTESKLASGAPLIAIPAEIVHEVQLQWTAEEQGRLAAVVKRLLEQTLTEEHGVAWRVHKWQLACFSFPLEEEGDHHNSDELEWRDEWDAARFVEGPVFRWLREFMGELMTKSATVPILDKEADDSGSPFTSPLPQKAVMFCPLPGQVRHVQWWLRRNFPQVQVVRMLSGDSADDRMDLMNEFQSTAQCAVFLTTTKVGGTGLNLVAANHAVILQKPWVLNEQRQACGRIVRLGQNRQPHCWLLNVGPGGYDDRVTELHRQSGAAQMRILHGLMNRPDISTEDIYNVLQTRQEETRRAEAGSPSGST